MWEVPRYRIRRYLRNVRKQRAESGKSKPVFHIRKTRAEMLVIDGVATSKSVIEGCVVLNDLAPTGLLLFSNEPLREGQRIQLTLDSPKLFYARARVTACKNISLQKHIYAERNFPYRIAIRFEFSTPEEQRSVAAYCKEIFTRFIYGDADF